MRRRADRAVPSSRKQHGRIIGARRICSHLLCPTLSLQFNHAQPDGLRTNTHSLLDGDIDGMEHELEETREEPLQTAQQGVTMLRESSLVPYQAKTADINDTLPITKRRPTQAPLSTQSDLYDVLTVFEDAVAHPTPNLLPTSSTPNTSLLAYNDAGHTNTAPFSQPANHSPRPSTRLVTSVPSHSAEPEMSPSHQQLVPEATFITNLRLAVNELDHLSTELNTIREEEINLIAQLERLATRKRSAEQAFDEKKSWCGGGGWV